jgi:hypothetical protein
MKIIEDVTACFTKFSLITTIRVFIALLCLRFDFCVRIVFFFFAILISYCFRIRNTFFFIVFVDCFES